MKVLFDMDTGVDDAFALLYALLKPQFEIVGISTVCGNVESSLAAENTLKILDLVDAPDIPVVQGALCPLKGTWDGRVAAIHGENGLGNCSLPPGSRRLLTENVADFHMRLASRYEGELTVIALGPLTNIALTLQKYPDFAKKVKRLIMMGGALHVQGNVSPVGEANVVCDPESCDLVFLSGMDVTAVGLDVTTRTRLQQRHMEWLTRSCSQKAEKAVAFLNKALQHYFYGNQIQNYCIGDCPVHDPLAVIYTAAPCLFRTEIRRARVECGGDYCRGMIVTDRREHPMPGGDIRFVLEADAERALRELLSAFWEQQCTPDTAT